MIRLSDSGSAEDIEAARALFRAYAASLDIDLAFQGFEEELAALPGKYARPAGRLIVAWDGGPLGVVAVRPLAEGVAEMKRLYVVPGARGTGLGRRLAEAAIAAARDAGYRAIRLDTLESMRDAKVVYGKLGFCEIPAYYDNPIPGTRYFERRL